MKRGSFYIISGVAEGRPRLIRVKGLIDEELQVGFRTIPWVEGEHLTALYDIPTGSAIRVFYTRGDAAAYVSNNQDSIKEIRNGDFYQACLADYAAMLKEVEAGGNIS